MIKTLPTFAMNQLLSSHTESYVGCQILTLILMSASK